MAESNLPPFAAPCKSPGAGTIHIGPRLHIHLCGELLELALAHEKLASDIQSIEVRFAALLALVHGAAR
jgi:hypothetical protein